MSYLRTFEQEDILINTLVTYPQFEWVMLSGNVYLNDRRFSGFDIKTGTINLFEVNVDRGTGLINPYVIKNGDMWNFGSTTTSSFDEATYGTKLTGAYPYTSSISRDYIFALNDDLSGSLDKLGILLPDANASADQNTNRQNLY